MALSKRAEPVVGGAPARRGFGWWAKRGLIVFVVIAIPLALGIPAFQGYRPRALINEALIDGSALRTKVAEYYQEHRRLPQPSEAKAFQLAPSDLKRAQAIVWDTAGRRVVITVGEPQPGKRVVLQTEERDGTLTWTCRTLDLEVKYLRGSYL